MAKSFASMLNDRIAEEENGVTLAAIAERLRVHHTMLTSWRRGHTFPGPKCRERLSVFLRVTPAQLGELIAAEKRRRARKQPVSAAEGFA